MKSDAHEKARTRQARGVRAIWSGTPGSNGRPSPIASRARPPPLLEVGCTNNIVTAMPGATSGPPEASTKLVWCLVRRHLLNLLVRFAAPQGMCQAHRKGRRAAGIHRGAASAAHVSDECSSSINGREPRKLR